MTKELKNFPFCGGKARISFTVKMDRCIVACKDCGIETPIKDAKRQAIAAWNRRAN